MSIFTLIIVAYACEPVELSEVLPNTSATEMDSGTNTDSGYNGDDEDEVDDGPR